MVSRFSVRALSTSRQKQAFRILKNKWIIGRIAN
jgi:hypothetical protein